MAARWEPAGGLTFEWTDPHAVVLGDGRVLLVGSAADDGTPRASVRDPVSAGWQAVDPLPKARSGFAMVALRDGRALVVGGLNDQGQSFSSTYAFGPTTNAWSKTAVMAAGRTRPAAAVLPDGRVLVAGGYFQQAEAALGPSIVLAPARRAAPAAGGRPGPELADVEPPQLGNALATAELYDPATDTFTKTGPMKFARSGAAATPLADGRILVVGSDGPGTGVKSDPDAADTAEIYDAATGTFTLTSPLPKLDRAAIEAQAPKDANPVPEQDPEPVAVGTVVPLADSGAVLIAHTGWWKHVGEVSRSFRLDPASRAWTEIPPTYAYVGEPGPVTLTTPGVPNREGAVAAPLPDGRVLVAGGLGPDVNTGNGYERNTTNDSDLYDPPTGAWTNGASMPEPRANAVVVVLPDRSILAIGGTWSDGSGGGSLSTIVRYVPAS